MESAMYVKPIKVRSYEKGLLFKDKEFTKILDQGSHWHFDSTGKTSVEIVSMRDPWLTHKDLDLIISSGQLELLERVAESSKLNIICGEDALSNNLIKLV